MLSQFVRRVAFRERSAIVPGCHDFSVCACRAEGKKIATMCAVQVDGFAKDIGRFANRPYYIVGFHRFFGGNVFYLVVCLVKGRADEVGHACIDNGELLVGALFYVYDACDEASALSYY